MKLKQESDLEISKNIVKNKITVDEKAVGNIIGLMSKNIYSDEASAFREYWLNTRESVDLSAKNKKKNSKSQGQDVSAPTEIQLPYLRKTNLYLWDANSYTTLSENVVRLSGKKNKLGYSVIVNPNPEEKHFYIRDYGAGLSTDELLSMITKAGASDKNTTNEYGGGMGIGSLAGFSVADHVTFTAYKDGVKTKITLSSDTNDYVLFPVEKTTEPNGLRVEFDLRNDESIENFTSGALKFLAMAPKDERALIYYNNENILDEHAALASERYGNKVVANRYYNTYRVSDSEVNVSVNGCFYKGTFNTDTYNNVFTEVFSDWTDKFDTLTEYDKQRIYTSLTDLFIKNYVWNVPVGHLTNISPSRESISLNAHDIKDFLTHVRELNAHVVDLAVRYNDKLEEIQLKNDDPELKADLKDVYDIILLQNENAQLSQEEYSIFEVLRNHFTVINGEVCRETNGFSIRLPKGEELPNIDGKSYGYFTLGEKGKTVDVIVSSTGETRRNGIVQKRLNFALWYGDNAKKKNIFSTSKSLDDTAWYNRIQEMNNESMSKIKKSSEKDAYKLVKNVSYSDLVVSSPAAKNMMIYIESQGVKVKPAGIVVDGLELRKAYTSLVKKARKARNEVKYDFINTKGENEIIPISEFVDKYEDVDKLYIYDSYNNNLSLRGITNSFEAWAILKNSIHKDDNIFFVSLCHHGQDISKLKERLTKAGVKYKDFSSIKGENIVKSLDITLNLLSDLIYREIDNRITYNRALHTYQENSCLNWYSNTFWRTYESTYKFLVEYGYHIPDEYSDAVSLFHKSEEPHDYIIKKFLFSYHDYIIRNGQSIMDNINIDNIEKFFTFCVLLEETGVRDFYHKNQSPNKKKIISDIDQIIDSTIASAWDVTNKIT